MNLFISTGICIWQRQTWLGWTATKLHARTSRVTHPNTSWGSRSNSQNFGSGIGLFPPVNHRQYPILLTCGRWIQFSKHEIKHLVNDVYCAVYFPSCNQMPAVIAHVLIEGFFSLCKFWEWLIREYITVSMHYSCGLVYPECKHSVCTAGLFQHMFAAGHWFLNKKSQLAPPLISVCQTHQHMQPGNFLVFNT